MKTAPRFFTAFSINWNACPADQLKKKSTTKKLQNNTTISSLQHSRQSCLWCCPSFCAPALGEPAVSNPKHVAMLFLTGRSRSQLSGELQREHGVCTMIGQMDALLLLSLKEMKAHLWKFHQGGKKKEDKKGRQRGFREDSPLSNFQTSKKKASSVFSSSDTFVPPLHACRHIPSNAQKAPTAHGQLCVHTHYLPPALITSRCHFRPIKIHFIWKAALAELGGTDQGVSSPREL